MLFLPAGNSKALTWRGVRSSAPQGTFPPSSLKSINWHQLALVHHWRKADTLQENNLRDQIYKTIEEHSLFKNKNTIQH